MTEHEKLWFAKEYIRKLANGINPLTDDLVSDDDIVNNVHISRCLFYVADILQQNLEAKPKQKAQTKPAFSITEEERSIFKYSDVPIPVSEIACRLNLLVDKSKTHRIKYNHIVSWLVEIGMLEILQTDDGKFHKQPTEQGSEYGIMVEHRTGIHGAYDVVLYHRNAQEFIVDNIDAIMGLAQCQKAQKNEQKVKNSDLDENLQAENYEDIE